MNFYVAIGLALNVMAFALVQVGKKTHGTEVQRGALQLLKGKLWQDATGATFHRSLDFIRPLHLQGLHSCPVDLGPSWLMDGKLQVDKRHMAETIKLQACQSGVLYNIQNRANRLHSRLQQSRENIFSALLVLPLSDLSFHISVAVRTWYGGSLMLVHHILGGPSNVTILLADDNEVEEFARLPRAMRYGGNHGGLGVSKILGNLRQLFSSLSDSDPIWLSTASRLSLAFKTAVWGFPTVGIAHGRTAEVLLQMGITPLTFDGYAIKSVKLWGLYCRACFHFHRDSTKVFCPKCGNDTVVRVPIIVDQDGVPTVLNPGRKLRTKGTVFSMPKPQGGRIWKPIFAEDEIRIGGRDRELRHAEKLHEKERQLRDPFNQDNAARGWYQRSTTNTGKTIMTSGGGPRMQVGYGRRVNPNANNFRGFKPKKR